MGNVTWLLRLQSTDPLPEAHDNLIPVYKRLDLLYWLESLLVMAMNSDTQISRCQAPSCTQTLMCGEEKKTKTNNKQKKPPSSRITLSKRS